MGIFDIFRRQTVNPVTAASTDTGGTSLIGRLAAIPRWMLLILGAFFAAILYWGVLGSLLSATRADLTVRPDTTVLPPGGSVAVATAAMLTCVPGPPWIGEARNVIVNGDRRSVNVRTPFT